MSRPICRIVPFAAAVATAVALAIPASASAATTCKLSLKTARSMGPTYVTLMKVTGTTCANGVSVTKAYHSCRLKKGKKGTCTTKVRGYSCTDRRPKSESIPTQYTGHVTCKKGGARITHDYQQDT
jgi:hypothetical protein